MSANTLSLFVAYLVFGLIASLLLRKGMPEDWEEGLLASVLGPPLFVLIITAVLGNFLWQHLGIRSRNEAEL
jgi:uncharacterized membrane protein YeaQ/YmgE (transglycosylase-associated protein family)